MPPHVHNGVKYSVEVPLFELYQRRLQSEADRHIDGGGLSGTALSNLRLVSAKWRIVANRAGYSFICAVLRYSDGAISRGHFRVPYAGRRQGSGRMLPNLRRYVNLDGSCPVCTLKGARAGSGADPGGPRRTGSRSRPEIGRRHSRRPR